MKRWAVERNDKSRIPLVQVCRMLHSDLWTLRLCLVGVDRRDRVLCSASSKKKEKTASLFKCVVLVWRFRHRLSLQSFDLFLFRVKLFLLQWCARAAYDHDLMSTLFVLWFCGNSVDPCALTILPKNSWAIVNGGLGRVTLLTLTFDRASTAIRVPQTNKMKLIIFIFENNETHYFHART